MRSHDVKPPSRSLRSAGVLAALALLGPASSAVAAPGAPADEAVSEVIDVTVAPGKPARPSLQIKVPDYSIDTVDFRFPSGLRVMFQRDDSMPVAAITAVTDHGSSDDPQGKEGIAHLVEHLWFRAEHQADGQDKLPKVWDLLESEMGCSLNAFTQYDITAYMTVCGGHNLEAMMKLESLRMSDTVANVTEDMVKTEIEVVRNEIRMRSENFNIPFFTVWEFVNKHMFGEDHPYHRPIAGDHTTIRNCRLADIQKFTEDYYTPDNTTIVAVGDFPNPSDAPAYYLDLLVRTFDLSHLHPDLTEDHIRKAPKPGIETPDPNNPDHWFLVPMNPEKPDELLPVLEPVNSRASEFAAIKPPDPLTTELGIYEGPVKDPTVVAAWTMPPGYQGNDTLLQVAGNVLSNIVAQGVRDDPRIKSFGGCGALPSKRSTTVLCTATVKDPEDSPARVAERMMDQVVQLYNPDLKIFLDQAFSQARMQFLSGILKSVDLYAAVGAGRATDIATFAHFTGDPAYYTYKMNETNRLQSFQLAELAETWLTRDRAASVLIKPLERDEVALLSEDTAGAGGHYRGGEATSILNPSVDPNAITPDFLREIMTLPDLARMDDFTLPNGLRVVLMPHSEAPVVNVALIARGGSVADTKGLIDYVNRFQSTDTLDPLQIAGEFGGGLSSTYESTSIRASAGNLDGAMWLLRDRIDSTRPNFGRGGALFRADGSVAATYVGKNDYIAARRSQLKKNWFNDEWNRSELWHQHLNPDHPLHDGIDWEDLDALKKTSGKDVREAIQSKWRPDNATLLVVGNLDTDMARKYAIKYFGSWEPKTDAVIDIPEIPGPNAPAGGRKIVVIDEPGKTQTDVFLACPLEPAEYQDSPSHQILGTIARMTLFTKLREEAGVVYSPYAGTNVLPGGTAYMFMSAAIQNDSALFAMERYIEFLEQAGAGEISETDLRLRQLSRASGYVVGQQSIDQMTGRLAGVIIQGEGWDAFERYADDLANLEVADLGRITEGCADDAFIAFQGPEDKIKAQLDEGGYEYEVLDAKERGEAKYESTDPKGYKKYLKKKEKKEAEKEDSDEDSEGSDEE